MLVVAVNMNFLQEIQDYSPMQVYLCIFPYVLLVLEYHTCKRHSSFLTFPDIIQSVAFNTFAANIIMKYSKESSCKICA